MLASHTPAPFDNLDWSRIEADLDARGWARFGPLFSAAECAAMAARYETASLFRSRVIMQRHGFGRGEYKYFASPLPADIASLRARFYERLAPVATLWAARLGEDARYPAAHADYLAACHSAGQTLPTPLLLRYGPGDYNRLHRDLYGPLVFPLQVVLLLSEPERDFTGGEFVLTEQRARMQTQASVVPLTRGEGVIFAVHHRPVASARGYARAHMRHGVSEVRTGQRTTLGLILHDAA